ncbi:MAG TPA: hypothetical protein VFP91_18290 [Vicinamibacterales bacterium]|nr:hypothetical protein [Vicinamibacterales bacterium]
MRRLLILSTAWSASVLVVASVISACSGAGHDASTAGATNAETPSRPVEQFKEVTIPRGTVLAFTLDDSVGSATSRVDERVRAHLTRPVVLGGAPVVPAGSELTGAVTAAIPSHRVRGRAQLGLTFNSLRDGSQTYVIVTPAIVRTAAGQMKKDTMKVAIPAAAGAVLGGVLGGGKGAVIGGAVGGGAGAGYVMSRRGRDIVLRAGTPLTLKLSEPLTVRVRDEQSN